MTLGARQNRQQSQIRPMLQPTAGQSLPRRLKMPCLLLVLAGGVVAFLRDHLDAGTVYAHLDLAVLAVDERLVACVDERVLVARFIGNPRLT